MQFLSFAQSLNIVDKTGDRIPLQPSAQLLDYEKVRSSRDIVIKQRQSFFTTWELARDLWTAFKTPQTHVAIVCAYCTDDAAIEETRRHLISMMPNETCCELRSRAIRFPNESEIRFLDSHPGAKNLVHGSTIHRLHVPEGAFFGEDADHFMMAKFECVPPNGEIVLESSLHEDGVFRKGFFFDVYQAALKDSSWRAHVFGGPVPKLFVTPV